MKRWETVALVVVACFVGACTGHDAPQGSSCSGSCADAAVPDRSGQHPSAVVGVAQKGPYVRGTLVTVQELDAKLQPTGRSFGVTTKDDLGAFDVPVNLTARFIEVIANGYYYDELGARLSSGPLTLRALADVESDGQVDVNLLTSLTAPLTRQLVAQGQPFEAAVHRSESSVLDALGFPPTSASRFEKLDLAAKGDQNAILLAASLFIQHYARSFGDSEVAELTQLLSQIGAALSDGGVGPALERLRAARCSVRGGIDARAVRANLEAHYAALGVEVSIPDFEPWLSAIGTCGDAGAAHADASVEAGGHDAESSEDAAGADVGVADATTEAPRDAMSHDSDAGVPDADAAASDRDGSLLDASPPAKFVAYTIPPAGSLPYMLAIGPGGDVWFTDGNENNRIGRLGPAGGLVQYTVPSNAGSLALEGITLGPDGNMWFTEPNVDKVGRITPSGSIKEFPTIHRRPKRITAGPDGNLWFSEHDGNHIGKLTTLGVLSEYPVPTAAGNPLGIAAGPDGNVWFTEWNGAKIGRITPSGSISEYSIPGEPACTGCAFFPGAMDITAGPDGNMWFTEYTYGKIGRITVDGVFTFFDLPNARCNPDSIALGPDQNLWFTESPIGVNRIGRMTVSGAVTEFAIPSGPTGHPYDIIGGGSGNETVWLTEYAPDGGQIMAFRP